MSDGLRRIGQTAHEEARGELPLADDPTHVELLSDVRKFKAAVIKHHKQLPADADTCETCGLPSRGI